MPWFRVDDGFDDHPKVLAAGNAPVGLWLRCGTYAARQLTDGFVPEAIGLRYGSRKLIAVLLRVVMFEPVHDHPLGEGWQIHDYLDYNPSRENVLRDRRSAAERQARAREKRGHGGSHAVTHAVGHTTPTRPDPTRPAAAAAEGAAAAAAAEAAVLHPAVEILRSKMQAHTALRALRFDTLTDAQQAELVALIGVHGDARLVSVAVRTLRAEPVILVTAFLGTWRALPPPGRRVAAVPALPAAADTPVQTAEGVATARELFEQIRKGGASS